MTGKFYFSKLCTYTYSLYACTNCDLISILVCSYSPFELCRGIPQAQSRRLWSKLMKYVEQTTHKTLRQIRQSNPLVRRTSTSWDNRCRHLHTGIHRRRMSTGSSVRRSRRHSLESRHICPARRNTPSRHCRLSHRLHRPVRCRRRLELLTTVAIFHVHCYDIIIITESRVSE